MTAKRTERQLRHLKELRAQTKASALTSAGQVQDLAHYLIRQAEKDKRYARLQQWQKVSAVSYAEGLADGWALRENRTSTTPAPKSMPAPKKHESGSHVIPSTIPPMPPLKAAAAPRARARAANGESFEQEPDIEQQAVLIARVVQLLQKGA